MTPDLIVANGAILTMDDARPRAEALAVAGGRVSALGSDAEIAPLAGPETRVIDADGATVLPGFVEAHMHLFVGAAELDHLSLDGVSGAEALAAAVAAYAAARPDDAVIMAQAASYALLGEGRRVTRHDLDAILPDRPFAITAADHHTVWANTAALRLSGLLTGLAVGPGNEVVMGADGLAEGELREGEAFQPIIRLAGGERARLGLSTGGEPDPAPTPEERAFDRAILRNGLKHCARHGITAIHNMDGNRYTLELLSEIEAEGALTARVRVPFHFKTFMDLDALDRAEEMTRAFASDTLRSGFVKLFMDGVIESWTAVMLEDFADRPGWRGEPLFEAARFAEIATEIDRRGLQIAVHAIGDGAVRTVLDGYAAARRANGPRDSRHRIEHIEVIHPDDIPRFAELGVIASMQPPHRPDPKGWAMEPIRSALGPARWPCAYATDDLRRAGARMVFSTDWPVSPIDPLPSLAAAIDRTPWAEGLSAQASTLMQALAHYTRDGAYAGFAEDRIGRLAPGMLADVVVLSGDVEAVDADGLRTLRAAATIAGGRVVWEG